MKRIEKPWGYEIVFAATDDYVGKIMLVKAGKRLSLQYHEKKDESFYLYEGRISYYTARPGEEEGAEVEMLPGEYRHIPPGVQHRVTAIEDSTIFEVSTAHLGDVVRLADDFGRQGTKDD